MALFAWLAAVAALALVCAAAEVRWRRRNRRLLALAASLPGPRPLPLLGNAHLFQKEFLNKMTWLVRTYGGRVRFWMGYKLNLLISDPHDVRYMVMSGKMNQKGKDYDILKEYIGSGLLAGGPTWRYVRKLCTPLHSKKATLENNVLFNQESELLIEDLASKDPQKTINIYKDVLKITTQCTCQAIMGLDKEQSQSLKWLDEVVESTDDMFSLVYKKISTWYLWIPIVFKLLGYQKKWDYYKKCTISLAQEIVDKRREDLQTKVIKNCQDVSLASFAPVDRLVLSPKLSEREICEQTFTLFIVSQEAAAKITSCMLLFMAHLPDWQDKVYDELLEVVGEDRPLTEEDLKRLVMLDAVFKEAVRYLPIGPFIQRTVTEDITLERSSTGAAPVTIPAGTAVVIPIHVMHRDPKYWEFPDRMMPSRFLSEDGRRKEPPAFLPFSMGEMDCSGRTFATSLVKILAARVVMNYRLAAEGNVEDLELDVAISTKFIDGTNMKVQRRKKHI